MVWSHVNYFFSSYRFPSKNIDSLAPLVTSDNLQSFLARFITYPIAPGFFFMAGLLLGINTLLGKKYSNIFFFKKSFYCLFFGVLLNLFGFGGKFLEFEVLYCFAILFLLVPFLRKFNSIILLSISLLGFLISQFLSSNPTSEVLNFIVRVFVLGGEASSHVRIVFPIVGWLGVFLVGYVLGQKGYYKKFLDMKRLVMTGLTFVLCFLLTKTIDIQNAMTSGNIWDYLQVLVANKIPPKFDFVFLGFCSISFVFLGGIFLSKKESWQNKISSILHIDALDWYVIHLFLLLIARKYFHISKTESFSLILGYCVLISFLTYFLVRLNMKFKRKFLKRERSEK